MAGLVLGRDSYGIGEVFGAELKEATCEHVQGVEQSRRRDGWVEEIRVIAATLQLSVTLKYGEYAYAP